MWDQNLNANLFSKNELTQDFLHQLNSYKLNCAKTVKIFLKFW